MDKKVIVITLHGMGKTEPGYSKGLESALAKKLGQAQWDRVCFKEVVYQSDLQPFQDAYWKKCKDKVRWDFLREFVLFSLSDATSLEAQKERPQSAYTKAQQDLLKVLQQAYAEVGNRPLPIYCLAYSLGCQVFSNYIWDAQHKDRDGQTAPYGVWASSGAGETLPAGPEQDFARLRTLCRLYTVGNNIPVFVAGQEANNIKPFEKPTPDFTWTNFFDPDDILGWPLAPLSPAYEALVEDRKINADGNNLLGFLGGWTPYSHSNYLTDGELISAMAADLDKAV